MKLTLIDKVTSQLPTEEQLNDLRFKIRQAVDKSLYEASKFSPFFKSSKIDFNNQERNRFISEVQCITNKKDFDRNFNLLKEIESYYFSYFKKLLLIGISIEESNHAIEMINKMSLQMVFSFDFLFERYVSFKLGRV